MYFPNNRKLTLMKINGRIYQSITQASDSLGIPKATIRREYRNFLRFKRKKYEVSLNKVIQVDVVFEEVEHD